MLIIVILIDLISFYALAYTKPNEIKPCQIIEEGKTDLGWKKIRIAQDEKVLLGADSLPEALKEMEQLKIKGQCSAKAQNCALASEGYAMGSWYRSVLVVDDQTVLGANDLGGLVAQFNQLREKGICE